MASTDEVTLTYNQKDRRYHFVLVDNDNNISSDLGSLVPGAGSPSADDYTILDLDFYEG